jgi:hypothetical protein
MKDYTPLIIFALALLVILRRSGRSRRVRMRNAWLFPAFGLLSAGSTLANEPFPSLLAIAILIVASAAGIAAGWFRALHVELALDSETGDITSKATPIGTYLIVGFMALRLGLGYAFNGQPGAGLPHGPPMIGAPKHGVDLFRLADAALLFSTFMSVAQRFEIWRRAQPLLAQYRAEKAAKEAAAPGSGL